MPGRDFKRIFDDCHFPHESKVVLVYTTKYTFVNNAYAHEKPASASFIPLYGYLMLLKVHKKNSSSIS